MRDLNDLYYFAMVVEHRGFATAERVLGIPKSRLSRRIAQLEADLGVRLLQRSTRRFAITDLGNSVYRHALSMMAEARAAHEAVDHIRAEPRGAIRVSVPVDVAQQHMPQLLPDFLALYPQVRVQLMVSNRRVDIIEEGVDVALRVSCAPDDDGSMVMRCFGKIQELMVASPEYLRHAGRPGEPGELAGHIFLSMTEGDARQRWDLHGPDGDVRRVELQPRVTGSDFPMLIALAKKGVGITLLPETVCSEAICSGALEVVLPQWHLPQGIFHAVFPSRRGLLPAVRGFIDFLAERAPGLM
jgi:DNA-binding transcriptional LysR family regulator